ncbi:MAG TPA: hypothetical protein VMO00_18395 [Methylomirabilota bacterium]|nr:hypothetical protein [Methylomirabilota bacterium]
MLVNQTWFPSLEVASAEMPVGLSHLDSELCWCDPLVEVDDEGRKVLLHRQVTWN